MTDKKLNLEEIEARANAATPEPWHSCEKENCGVCDATGNTRADRQFIAHARTDIPLLIAEVRRLAERLTYSKTNLRAAREEVLSWKAKYLKARSGGYQEGLEEKGHNQIPVGSIAIHQDEYKKLEAAQEQNAVLLLQNTEMQKALREADRLLTDGWSVKARDLIRKALGEE